jgi:hypothetical protein
MLPPSKNVYHILIYFYIKNNKYLEMNDVVRPEPHFILKGFFFSFFKRARRLGTTVSSSVSRSTRQHRALGKDFPFFVVRP